MQAVLLDWAVFATEFAYVQAALPDWASFPARFDYKYIQFQMVLKRTSRIIIIRSTNIKQ